MVSRFWRLHQGSRGLKVQADNSQSGQDVGRRLSQFIRCAVRALVLPLAVALAGCTSGDPGRLGGTWLMTSPLKMKIQFRQGEVESLGIIEKVSYESKGNDVIVTYESGLMKGNAVRYTLLGRDVARSELGEIRRIK